MKINQFFIFFVTTLIFGSISISQSTNVGIQRRNKDGICVDNKDCFSYEKCEEKKCIDACLSANCGTNSWCTLENHEAECKCWENYIGDPHTECIRKNCTTNDECFDFEKCENNQCVMACNAVLCGDNAQCTSRDHNAYCTCIIGTFGDPATKCEKKSCSVDSDCFFSEKCDNNECINVCKLSSCGENAWCDVRNHSAICTCYDKYFGDPHIRCMRQNCTANDDCDWFEKCESNKCINACDSVTCGENAWCHIQNHVAECQCNFRMVGDPLVNCTNKECSADSDCLNSEYCEDKKCTKSCENVLCGSNALCKAINHTASCVCEEKYTGDPQTKCVRESCASDSDCYSYENCQDNECVLTCGSSVCEINAWCEVNEHVANCTCQSGFTGDPHIKCTEKVCTTHSDCSDSELCENEKCINACENVYCPLTTICKAQNHTGTCACWEKYDGDAYSGCVRQNCSANNDCFDHEICKNNKCIFACESVKCGENAWCDVKNHTGVCTCFSGLTGNPLIKCEGDLDKRVGILATPYKDNPLLGKVL